MKQIPITQEALVLRTDYSDEATWVRVKNAIAKPVMVVPVIGGFRANVEFASDPDFNGLSPEQVIGLLPRSYPHTFLFVVDARSIADTEYPILVMDLYVERGRTFRVIPEEMWAVENNLSIANMDFAEFADNVDPDGVFRGFPKT